MSQPPYLAPTENGCKFTHAIKKKFSLASGALMILGGLFTAEGCHSGGWFAV